MTKNMHRGQTDIATYRMNRHKGPILGIAQSREAVVNTNQLWSLMPASKVYTIMGKFKGALTITIRVLLQGPHVKRDTTDEPTLLE